MNPTSLEDFLCQFFDAWPRENFSILKVNVHLDPIKDKCLVDVFYEGGDRGFLDYVGRILKMSDIECDSDFSNGEINLSFPNFAVSPQEIISALHENTWLGCAAINAKFKKRECELVFGAGSEIIKHKPRSEAFLPISCGSRFYAAIKIPSDKVHIKAFCGTGKPVNFEFEMKDFLKWLNVAEEKYYGYLKEIRCLWNFEIHSPDLTDERILMEQFKNDTHDFFQNNRHIKNDIEKEINRVIKKEANDLDDRKKKLQKIVQSGGDIIPKNEMEAIVHSVRNEDKIGEIFPEFKILENSPRGIDSFIHCKASPETPAEIHCAEFEADIRNFFNHKHPLRQVQFIVCWTSDSILDGKHQFGLDRFGSGPLEFSIETSQDHHCVRSIMYKDHHIRVLDLKRLYESV